jgi:amino acid transporter
MSLLDVVFGRPLASKEERAEKIGAPAAIPIFGLDALSSAAYGPEAALTLLIPLGAAGIAYILPVTFSILVLLLIVFFSYRQTIAAYPGGGGSYTVASENLGSFAGLLAAAALMIDYVLTAAVGISAGVGALVSAAPSLQPHILPICLGILTLITLVNLRGVREAGAVFMVPTYMFLGSLLVMIAIGVVKVLGSHGHPMPVVMPPPARAARAAVSNWLLLQVFASGCTAMTGVEAVSNGVKAFREPVHKNAQRALTVIILLLTVLLAGIAYLVASYGISATDPNGPGYESVLSMLLAAVAGKGIFYYVAIGSILLVLALSANTAFADFPRLCRIIAHDSYLPHPFASTGRRLVYTYGICILALLTALLLILFGGVTDRLIPLYAVGAFLAFTLSQAGMVVHWLKNHGSWFNMLLNGLGALATGVTVLVVLVAKFAEGAWITLLMIPILLYLMYAIRRHYDWVQKQVATTEPLNLKNIREPLVLVPIQNWNKISQKGLRLACGISKEVRALHVSCEDDTDNTFCASWKQIAQDPAQEAGYPPPELVVLPSPYRFVLRPILDYIRQTQQEAPGREITVLIPDLIESHWHEGFMHNQRAMVLKGLLFVRGNKRISVMNVPWYLSDED